MIEHINSDGTVKTSNLNWGNYPEQVSYVTFKPGVGVKFITRYQYD
ncbi:hypothetical protein EI42_04311 [Thermosporothrix hazakensis]|uniref:Uncharacterized protein n=1 Tax=Thermosporothrix hazakensis TaxID=644383 RepID=A0A326U1W0_THEHA|nr:hypothetical protein EI42_04311 [Thermosporothrix hazakensis]GCE50493.1 hypothetical protein KTH_53620 [Thermosporothrix hazakensis]